MSRLSGMYAEATWDPLTANDITVATTLSVPGAKPGDFVFVSFDNISAANADDIVMSGTVTVADSVVVSVRGDSTAPNLGAGTVRVKVVPVDAI